MKDYTTFDYPALPANSTYNVRLMLTLCGDGMPLEHKTPLNIAMVIDNSGSMKGEKIAKVKEAAAIIVKMLKPQDMFSLVTFNDTVETIVPVAKGGDLAGVETLIEAITAKGNTNLCGGYEQGFDLASEGRNFAMSRIVLLSDGKANVGTSSLHDLNIIARKFRDSGVTTSTFGVGYDFDELLLTGIAEEGGGSANIIDYPWQAAEVFGEELEDLRNVTSMGTGLSFTPSKNVISCTMLNNFPDYGGYDWGIGDLYSTRDLRIVLELEIQTDAETSELQLGAFELLAGYPPGLCKITPQHIPVSIPVVSEKEFASIKVDTEVTLEAALLAIGRAKREAMQLASNRKFVEAADLLDRYLSAIYALNLNDLELDRELSLLKERAWNLRHRGQEFFTAAEQKHFAYEADMTGKGKKDKYRAMMMRREQKQAINAGGSVVVYSLIDGREFMVPWQPARMVSDFLKDVFLRLDGAVRAKSYGVEWVLRDKISGRIFDAGSSFAKAQGVREDRRALVDAGFQSGMVLEVVPLTAMPSRQNLNTPAGVIRVDLAQLGITAKGAADIRIAGMGITRDFLDAVYEEIRDIVPPNSYGRTWLLRDTATGRVYDVGSSWARYHGLQHDVRPLAEVGIRGGSMLQAVLLT